MQINLFYLARPTLGGWVTYTKHLIDSLVDQGLDADQIRLYKITNRGEKRVRTFAPGITYQNINMDTALKIVTSSRSNLILALDRRLYEIGLPLLEHCNGIVIHDTTEINNKFVDFAVNKGIKTIAIRKVLKDHLQKRGVDSVYIPHPYKRTSQKLDKTKTWHAVATSRLDWDKYTHYIVAANEELPKDKQVKIYGAENRLYTHNKLTPTFPKWRDYHFGKFPCSEALPFAARSEFVVDLTEIKNDGGGTQYTFLEAFDAGSTLIVNKNWFRYTDEGCLEHGENCIKVDSGEELKFVLEYDEINHERIRKAGEAILEDHKPSVIVPQYLEYMDCM